VIGAAFMVFLLGWTSTAAAQGTSRGSTEIAKASAAVPGFPDLDDLTGSDVERFEMTVSGLQQGSINFTWDPSPVGNCHLFAAGSLDESWHYGRGKQVVMEFSKLGDQVLLKRAGRPLGDGAFAAPGTIVREASGQFQAPSGLGCPSFALRTADCGPEFKVRSDLALGWSKGQLTLQHSGPAAQKKNPAEGCGTPKDLLNFNQLVHAYPYLNKQRAALSARQIFGSKPAFRLTMNDKFLAPADEPAGYTTFTARGAGRTSVTLKRLPAH
jgi:hypothetical protein